MSSATQIILLLTFPIWMSFIFLAKLLWLELPVLLWIEVVAVGILALSLNYIRGRVISLLPLWCSLGAFHIWLLLCWSNCLLFLVFGVMKGCWILSKAFSASRWSWVFLVPFILLMWCTILITFSMCNHPSILGKNPTCSWCIILLIGCLIWFAGILFKIFESLFIRATNL